MPQESEISIDFGLCTVTWEPQHRRCVTRFRDGSQAYAIPHDTDAYRAHAEEKSTGDTDLYCWQHDVAHVLVALISGRGPSKVLFALAHGQRTDTPACEDEEQEAQALQRALFLRK